MFSCFYFFLTEDPHFLQAAKEATQSAVKCGIEINIECGNYAINLSKDNVRRTSKFNKVRFLTLLRSFRIYIPSNHNVERPVDFPLVQR